MPGVLMEHGTPSPRHNAAACKRGPARDRAEGLRGFSDATMATSSPEGGRPPIGPSLASSSIRISLCTHTHTRTHSYTCIHTPGYGATRFATPRLSSAAFSKSTRTSAMADLPRRIKAAFFRRAPSRSEDKAEGRSSPPSGDSGVFR